MFPRFTHRWGGMLFSWEREYEGDIQYTFNSNDNPSTTSVRELKTPFINMLSR